MSYCIAWREGESRSVSHLAQEDWLKYHCFVSPSFLSLLLLFRSGDLKKEEEKENEEVKERGGRGGLFHADFAPFSQFFSPSEVLVKRRRKKIKGVVVGEGTRSHYYHSCHSHDHSNYPRRFLTRDHHHHHHYLAEDSASRSSLLGQCRDLERRATSRFHHFGRLVIARKNFNGSSFV